MVDPQPLIHQNSFNNRNLKVQNDIEQNPPEEEQGGEQNDQDCPPDTNWTVQCHFCGLNYVTIDNSSEKFCNWWQCLPCMPIFVGALIISMFFQFFFLLYPRCRSKTFQLVGIILISFFGFLFFISYSTLP